ncbi:MAG: META domain-containing protein [Flavobacteriales bacterium]|nr:META domain-containing protein [Flavobacteriales bacterium]MCB9168287.1 META domain-containing protein [Flavobacteriales bacterium]
MKRLLMFSALALVLSANKCSEKKMGGDVSTDLTSLAGGQWMLATLNGKPIELPEGAKTPWVKLEQEGARLSGYGGCNQLMGSYKLEGDHISFPGLGSTKMMCPAASDLESKFMNALRLTDGFKMDGDVLRLFQGTAELATLRSAT